MRDTQRRKSVILTFPVKNFIIYIEKNVDFLVKWTVSIFGGTMEIFENESRAVGVIAIIIKNRTECAEKVNQILTGFGQIIVGRMGIPYHERNLNIITLIVDASNDQIGSLTGKLGQIEGVTVKSTLAKI